jgi:hypothetical protein
MAELQLEVNQNLVTLTAKIPVGEGFLTFTMPANEDYWLFRVRLFKDQSIIGFPKYGTIGIGFAIESDWNTNFPYTCDAEKILLHIAHNRKYREIASEDCLEAIKMIQSVARQYLEEAKK